MDISVDIKLEFNDDDGETRTAHINTDSFDNYREDLYQFKGPLNEELGALVLDRMYNVDGENNGSFSKVNFKIDLANLSEENEIEIANLWEGFIFEVNGVEYTTSELNLLNDFAATVMDLRDDNFEIQEDNEGRYQIFLVGPTGAEILLKKVIYIDDDGSIKTYTLNLGFTMDELG